MNKFYATSDSHESDRIRENATIHAFNTRADAEKYLRRHYGSDEWVVTFTTGRFSDCWIKCLRDPTDGHVDTSPFELDDCDILRPGQHPGGRMWWIEPKAEILVANPYKLGGYIIHDNEGVIHGSGDSIQSAWEDAEYTFGCAGVTLLDDADSDAELGAWTRRSGLIVRRATAALLDEIERDGGAVAWSRLNGVAATLDEANSG